MRINIQRKINSYPNKKAYTPNRYIISQASIIIRSLLSIICFISHGKCQARILQFHTCGRKSGSTYSTCSSTWLISTYLKPIGTLFTELLDVSPHLHENTSLISNQHHLQIISYLPFNTIIACLWSYTNSVAEK